MTIKPFPLCFIHVGAKIFIIFVSLSTYLKLSEVGAVKVLFLYRKNNNIQQGWQKARISKRTKRKKRRTKFHIIPPTRCIKVWHSSKQISCFLMARIFLPILNYTTIFTYDGIHSGYFYLFIIKICPCNHLYKEKKTNRILL